MYATCFEFVVQFVATNRFRRPICVLFRAAYQDLVSRHAIYAVSLFRLSFGYFARRRSLAFDFERELIGVLFHTKLAAKLLDLVRSMVPVVQILLVMLPVATPLR